jgi:very-short-patch-repair endonuclease
LSYWDATLRVMTRSKRLDEIALATTLRAQQNVIARQQALDCGMTPRALEHRIRTGGPWQRLLPGIYLAVTGRPGMAEKEMAALLYAGPGSVLTGPAALRHHGIRAPATATIDVLVPGNRQRQSSGFVTIRYTTRMPELICREAGLVSYAYAERAVADTARSLTSLREVRAVVAAGVQGGLCIIGCLDRELSRGPMQGSALLRRALAEVADGIRSTTEADLRDLIKRARFPAPMFNARLYLGTRFLGMPDCWWPEAGVAAEVDSREWHLSPEDWQRTMERHARMSACGIIVLHFPPSRIRTEPAVVAATIRDALQAGRARPRLPVKARRLSA